MVGSFSGKKTHEGTDSKNEKLYDQCNIHNIPKTFQSIEVNILGRNSCGCSKRYIKCLMRGRCSQNIS